MLNFKSKISPLRNFPMKCLSNINLKIHKEDLMFDSKKILVALQSCVLQLQLTLTTREYIRWSQIYFLFNLSFVIKHDLCIPTVTVEFIKYSSRYLTKCLKSIASGHFKGILCVWCFYNYSSTSLKIFYTL